ncbi:hypothetical protein A0H81_05030 [Grifola frondosa]|uniref:Uncharacterized protein n=1 Tax=Grifola frondosa TaxID=5627 RepID=A0A1C7MFW5_GRIFR|nr:hypothetical protein A0H81_05030 [Grifola frondosa]
MTDSNSISISVDRRERDHQLINLDDKLDETASLPAHLEASSDMAADKETARGGDEMQRPKGRVNTKGQE